MDPQQEQSTLEMSLVKSGAKSFPQFTWPLPSNRMSLACPTASSTPVAVTPLDLTSSAALRLLSTQIMLSLSQAVWRPT